MAKFQCAHCRGEYDTSAAITDKMGRKFCCVGCEGVFKILNENNLSEFYDRLGKNNLAPVLKAQNLSPLNIENLEKLVVKNGEICQISLLITGIHCAACVWLNEKILVRLDGILEVEINAINHKAKIVWDAKKTNLSEICALINSVGYGVSAYDENLSKQMARARRELYARLLVGIFCVMNIMWLSVAQYSGYFGGISQENKDIMSFAQFILATPVLFYTGSGFLRGGYFGVKNGALNMDLLVSLGALAAYVFSIYAMFARVGEVYFDSVSMIITFVFGGKFLENLGKRQAFESLEKINAISNNLVRVKSDKKIEQKDAKKVKTGEIIVLEMGEQALIDGVIKKGEASFDLSSLTGESVPVFLKESERIDSGALCLDGLIEYEASANFKDSKLGRILELLENASKNKPRIQRLADEICARFLGAVLALCAITFCFWLLNASFETALITAISVIIIACPCALALATPIATTIGLGAGLKMGIVFKQARTIESLAKCDTIIFDKTGTLTKNAPRVNKFELFCEFDKSLLYSLLSLSSHPISAGVAKFCEANFKNLANLELTDIKTIKAKGVRAKFNGLNLAGGSALFMRELGINALESDELSEYFFAINKNIVAKFELRDELKDEAKFCVGELEKMGLSVQILSGDNRGATERVASELGVKFSAQCLSEKKAEMIANLTKNHRVIMVGDGVNDAAALALSNVAICMGGGAGVSIEKSDVVLLNSSLNALINALKIARKTLKIIRQNLAFSFIYNALTIPLAMAGLVSPAIAAASMSLSSLVVILNALRINKNGAQNLNGVRL